MVRTGPYSFQNVDTVYELVKAALNKGYKCSVFMYEDGVLNIHKGIKSPGERNIAEHMKELVTKGVEIAACGNCAKFRGLGKDSIIDGTKLAGMAVLTDMVDKSDRFVTFGF